MNPVLSREILERFRTRRAPWFIFGWTLGIGLIGYVVYLVSQQVANGVFGMGRLVATGFMGRFLFQALALLMMTAVVMVVPGITSLSIVGERERQTLSLLQVTQLSPLQLILGKLTSSLSYFSLLLIAVAPIMALPLLFGGMSFGDVLGALAVMLLTAVMIGSVSLLISARARSSRGAVAGSYVFSFIVAFFTIAMLLAELLLVRGSGGAIVPARGREVYSSWLNPYVAMVDAVQTPLSIRNEGQFTPFTAIDALLYARQGISGSMLGGFPVPAGGVVLDEQARQLVRLRRGPVWLRTAIIYLVITALALMRSARIVRAPAARPFRLKRYRHVPG
ncbi:MAG TPA: ABC transporter permease [Acidimicrobiia bacterium]|jgi:ABC-type transport system involved in multi-copper enzyme maturation permease subunit|nr:ABC transporter permease [Acidimicrobiia bacterium]